MFTCNQIEEIKRKLQLIGRKDTSFPLAKPLSGNEIIAIVQQGQNKQLGLKTLIEKIGKYTTSDFTNLSKYSENSYTIGEAIKLVEPVNRRAGQVITFMDSSTGKWAIYQFKGSTASEWLNLQLWDNILAVVDNLDSDTNEKPLSAKQGKVLKEMIEAIQTSGVVVDSALSETSEHPVQNKVITEALNKINTELFPLSISVSGGGLYEKRTTQTITVKWTIKEGSNTVTPDTLSVNNESVSVSTTSKVFEGVTGNTTYTVKAVKNGVTVQGSTSVTFVNPSYFGAVDAGFTPTEDAIKALAKSVKSTKSYTGSVSLENQKTCYAYPKSMGALTAIKDANNFEYLQSYTRSEVTVWNEAYYVYVLTDPVTIDTFKQIYS